MGRSGRVEDALAYARRMAVEQLEQQINTARTEEAG